MTFLNPFVLFGLAAAAIPILIHLFNIRKLRTIEFSTLTFLKELNKKKIRRIKIRQWLLLLLRTLLILLIVLAFSRPALKGNFGSAGTRATSTIVILLDNSASMQYHNQQGKFLSQAQQKALEIIATLNENDEVFFLRLSDLPNATTEEPTRDIATVTSRIRGTEISYKYRTIEDGLRLASRLLQQSRNFVKEVYVITDGQSTTLSSDAAKPPSGEKLFEPQVKIFYTPLSERHQENIAIERTAIPPSLMQVNRPFTLTVVVKNYGTSTVNNHLVTITLDKNRVMQKSVTLNGGESATLDFTLTPSRSGFLSGYAELEDDDFEADNRYYFTVHIPEKINIALVAPEEKYLRYIAAALNVAAAASNSSPVNIFRALPSQISSTILSNNDVIIFSGVKDFSSSQEEIIKQFVMNGGSVIFFPSSDTAAVSYRYLSQLGVNDLRVSRSSSTFENIDMQFPIFQGMFEQGLQKKRVTVESPRVTVSLNASSESNLRSIISLSNGKYFLWQRELGRGKLLGLAVPATTEWSDLPMRGIFVPLLYQSILYLSSPVNTSDERRFTVGEQMEFSSSELKNSASLSPSSMQLFDTEQRILPMHTYVKSTAEGLSHTIFTFEHAEHAGIYSVVSRKDTILSIPINIRREESHCDLSDNNQRDELLKRLGIEIKAFTEVPANADMQQTISESRFGIELWRYFLIAALIIAAAEMLIAREPKQSR